MRRTRQVSLLLALSLAGGVARADVEFKFGGSISSDIRFRLAGAEVPPGNGPVPYPSQYRLLPYGFSRNENIIKAQLSLSVSSKVKAVADVDFFWWGYSDVNDLDSATLRERVDPFRVDSYAAYVDIYNLFKGFDVRIGRQVVHWGAADKFNPTNNLNSLDYSDPLLFGRALGNQMIRVDYNPWRDLIFTVVWVPIFRPAQLPRWSTIALTDPSRPPPVQEDSIRDTLNTLAMAMPPSQVNVYTMQPEPTIQNSQVGARVAGRLLGVDLSISYYHGRFGLPVPSFTINKPNGIVDVLVMWPKMDVLGADLAGTIDKLGGLGYWVEAAVFFPQHITYGIYNQTFGGHDPVTFERDPASTVENYNLRQGLPEYQRGTIIGPEPFLKLTAGIDYSVNQYFYFNFQYVYGFIDEFGAGKQPRLPLRMGDRPRVESRIGHYLVAGGDLKLFRDQLLIRIFAAFKVPQHDDEDPRFTAVLFPQIAWAVWDATEITFGSFIFLGDRASKFGDPSTGATELFLKAKFTY
jgi:hypothetical protein